MRRMRSRVGWTLLVVSGLFGGLAAVPPVGAEEGALRVVSGRVNAVNPAAGSLTVGDAALTVNGETELSLNGRAVSLNDLAVGDSAQASFDPTTRVAREVRADRPLAELWGTITTYTPATGSADASLAFRLPDGGSVTLFVNASTLIPLDDGDTLEGVVGRNALARYDRVTMVAKEVAVGAPAPTPTPAPTPAPTPTPTPAPTPAPEPRCVLGWVVGIDAEHQTLALSVQRKVSGPRIEARGVKIGPGVRAVLVVDEDTVVTLNDQPATLADLARGDRARCTFVVEGGNPAVTSAVPLRFRAVEVRATLPPAKTVGGKVVKVDSEGSTVALGNPKRPTTLVVTGGTWITLDGKEATLAQLQADQRATALFVVRNEVPQALAIVAMSPPVRRQVGKGASKKQTQ